MISFQKGVEILVLKMLETNYNLDFIFGTKKN